MTGTQEPGDLGPGPVVIVGTGLVGSSIGHDLTQAGVSVHLSDRIRSHAMVAAGLGAGVLEQPDPGAVRLVVVAVPPDSAAAVIVDSLARYPHAVVTDVVSVKGLLRRQVQEGSSEAARYVGSHPMAGSHHTGPLTAVPQLFVDRTWVITDQPGNPAWAVSRVRQLAELCHARVVHLDADQHDEAVAQVSHVPQLMSTLTAAHLRDVPDEHLVLAGQGIRDVTRIAASDPDLWRQIVTANAGAIRRELEGIRADLDELLDGLDDPQTVEGIMLRGRWGARALPGKHGGRSREWDSIVIEIPDTPGALARLFVDIDGAGVNVEDLSIEHDAAREVGFLSVAVSPERADGLREAMQQAGWTVRG